MTEQIVTVKGTKRIPRAEWDAMFQDLPTFDPRSLTPEQLEQKWRNAPRLERMTDGSVVLIPAGHENPPTDNYETRNQQAR